MKRMRSAAVCISDDDWQRRGTEGGKEHRWERRAKFQRANVLGLLQNVWQCAKTARKQHNVICPSPQLRQRPVTWWRGSPQYLISSHFSDIKHIFISLSAFLKIPSRSVLTCVESALLSITTCNRFDLFTTMLNELIWDSIFEITTSPTSSQHQNLKNINSVGGQRCHYHVWDQTFCKWNGSQTNRKRQKSRWDIRGAERGKKKKKLQQFTETKSDSVRQEGWFWLEDLGDSLAGCSNRWPLTTHEMKRFRRLYY